MWQKCPVCNGTGKDPLSEGMIKTSCTVCVGMKIISEVNGKPPKHDGDKCPYDPTKDKLC